MIFFTKRMGFIVETAKRKYDNFTGKWGSTEYGFFLPLAFNQKFRFIKSREGFRCMDCNNKFGKGVMCIGKDYYNKRCFFCAIKMFEEMYKGIDKLKEKINDNIERYNKNKTKWEKEAVLDKLENGNE